MKIDYHSTRKNKSRQPMTNATSRSAVNSKESTIHQIVKSTLVDTHPHKAKKNITTTVQDSSIGSKPLITLSAMGFISATYSENLSSEQPKATPSPITNKFAEGRKDLTNPKA